MKKKLFLNKQTVIQLNNAQQQQIKGGTTFEEMTYCDCDYSALPYACEISWDTPDCESLVPTHCPATGYTC